MLTESQAKKEKYHMLRDDRELDLTFGIKISVDITGKVNMVGDRRIELLTSSVSRKRSTSELTTLETTTLCMISKFIFLSNFSRVSLIEFGARLVKYYIIFPER